MSNGTTVFRPTTTLAQAGVPSRSRTLRSMRKPTEPGSPIWSAVILFAVIIVLVVIAAQIVRRLRAMIREPGPKLELFNELVAAHGLTRAEQKALRRLVRREKLGVPAKVFVQPAYLKAYGAVDPVCRQLYEKLFA